MAGGTYIYIYIHICIYIYMCQVRDSPATLPPWYPLPAPCGGGWRRQKGRRHASGLMGGDRDRLIPTNLISGGRWWSIHA